MDGQRFDDLTRVLGASLTRKRLVSLLAGLLGAGAVAAFDDSVSAKKRGRKHRQRDGGKIAAQGSSGCGAPCQSSTECQGCPFAVCDDGVCATQCLTTCLEDSDCLSSTCVCHDGFCACTDGNCAPTCGGFCEFSAECAPSCACVDNFCVPTCPGNCDDDPEVCNQIPGEDDCICPNGECHCTDGTCLPLACGGDCSKDSDCPNLAGCICNEDTGQCETVTCGGACIKDTDCPQTGGCFCAGQQGGGGVQGFLVGQCVTEVCGGSCKGDSECEGALGCVCDENEGQCITVGCGGTCTKDSDCPVVSGCFCDEDEGLCTTATCPGTCEDNADCQEQGADSCVCFLGVNTANAQTCRAGHRRAPVRRLRRVSGRRRFMQRLDGVLRPARLRAE